MSGVTCNNFPWTPHTIGRCQAWHTIIAFRLHTWLDHVRRGIQSYTLVSTYSRMTSSVSCNRRLLTSHIVGRRQSWNARMSLGQETQTDDIGRCMTSSPWTTYKIRRCRVWHVIIALGQNTRSDDIGRGMRSYTLDCT